MKQGILCIFSGPPLSGKSTLIGGLKKQLSDLVIVSTDEIRFELSRDYQFRPEMESLVWELAYQRARSALKQGHLVAFDATLINPEYRGKLLLQFPQTAVIYFAFVKPAFSLVEARNERRKWKQIDATALKNMYDHYQFPTDSEKTYYYRVFEVTNENFSATIDAGVTLLRNLHG
ncbi:MAG: AAA family ATPase [Bacilli bacterium]